jgi:hypothetical protein
VVLGEHGRASERRSDCNDGKAADRWFHDGSWLFDLLNGNHRRIVDLPP